MSLQELEQDVKDYEKVWEEARLAADDAQHWSHDCWRRFYKAFEELQAYKKEHNLS